MKNIILILLLLTLVGCTGCGRAIFYKYTIRNESGKSIKIKVYGNAYPSSDDIPNIINLDIGEELTKTYQDVLPPSGYDFVDFFQGAFLIVLYDNIKIQRYDIYDGKKCDKNPLYKSPFCVTGSPTESTQTFIFTEEDYQNAEDCNGNCE